MKNHMFIRNKDYCYYIIAIAICLLLLFFERYVTEAFEKAADFLSKCEKTPWAIIIVTLSLIMSIYCFCKIIGKNKEYVSHKQIATLLLVAIIYVYYRARKSSPFEFWGFELGGYNIAWTDLLFLPLALRLIQAIVYKTPTTASENMQALLSDKSIGSEEEDLLGYNNYVNDLLLDLNTLNLSESYSIGITGDWGQGKSSFLNLLKQGVEKQKDLCLVFSPRNSKNISTIQEDFFKQLNKTLRKHHTNLGHSFQRYKKALSIINTGWLGKLFSFVDALDVDDEKKTINNAIQRIGKRLFIIVEDFDRLTAEEILEVLKVIDRNGDFNNTIYLTAYDKRYINSVLSKHFSNESVQDYSDKYFQHEYSLPAQQSTVIIDFISNHFKKVSQSWDGVTEANVNKFLKTNERTIVTCLPSLRHAKRFLNVFCSRYPKIRQDVYFSDFFLLTLLRYVDVQAYYALARLEIVSPGSFLNYQSKCYTLVETAVDDNNDKKWKKITKELLNKLFPSKNNSVNYNRFVNRICWIDSFDLYFYDYRTERAYYKDLVPLFVEESDQEAYQRLDLGLKNGQNTDIENFLCSRTAGWIANGSFLSRLIKLLCYLNHKEGRSVVLESEINTFLRVQTAKEYASYFSSDEYKHIVEESFREALEFSPVELGMLFIREIDSINDDNDYNQALLFSQEELVAFAEWAQRYYYQRYGEPDFDFNTAFLLANIRTQQNRLLSSIVEPAKAELVSMMQQYPEAFAEEIIIHQMIYKDGDRSLRLAFNTNFLADQYFPTNGVDFNDWIAQLSSEHTQYVLKTVYSYYMEGKKFLQVEALKDDYKKGDFDAFYEAVIKDSIRQLDATVHDAIEEGFVFDLSSLKEKIRANEDELKASICRLVEAKTVDAKYLKLQNKMAPFVVGDIVQLSWKEFVSLNTVGGYKTNLFNISKIYNNKQYELTGWNKLFTIQDLRPVFIDDEVSQNIYYDPVVAAPTIGWRESIPTHKTNYDFFMKHFENCFDYGEISFKERIEQKGFLYVHEVQHWLREEFGSDDLKIQ